MGPRYHQYNLFMFYVWSLQFCRKVWEKTNSFLFDKILYQRIQKHAHVSMQCMFNKYNIKQFSFLLPFYRIYSQIPSLFLAVSSYFGFRLTYFLQSGMLGKRKYIEPNYLNILWLAVDCDSPSRREHFYWVQTTTLWRKKPYWCLIPCLRTLSFIFSWLHRRKVGNK